MKSYEATSTIQAKPESIWAVLIDGSDYSQWNSGLLLPLIWASMPNLSPSFEQLARGLKEQVEKRYSALNTASSINNNKV